MVSVPEQLRLLLELQELDGRIDELKRKKEELPQRLLPFQVAFKKNQAGLTTEKNRFEALQKERRSKERNLEAKEEQLKKYQVQIYEVKTNREYTALLHEIERAKVERSKLEEEILILMDEVENLSKSIKVKTEELKAEEEVLKRETQKVEEEVEVINVELEKLVAERSGLAGKVEGGLLRNYEKLRLTKGELVVVRVINGICQGCHMSLPPQLVIELKKNQRIINCENCARILYWA